MLLAGSSCGWCKCMLSAPSHAVPAQLCLASDLARAIPEGVTAMRRRKLVWRWKHGSSRACALQPAVCAVLAWECNSSASLHAYHGSSVADWHMECTETSAVQPQLPDSLARACDAPNKLGGLGK